MQTFQRIMGGMNPRQRSHRNQIRSAVRSDMSWNFVRVHEIFFQTCFIPKKKYFFGRCQYQNKKKNLPTDSTSTIVPTLGW